MNKIISTKKITLIDNGEVVPTKQDGNNISDPILKLIVNYKESPLHNYYIESTQQVVKILMFIFTCRKKRYVRGDTDTGRKKAAQESDIPSRIIHENSDIFG